jgi:hypothetical protein
MTSEAQASNFRGFWRATTALGVRETRSCRLRGRGPVGRRGALRGGGAAPDARAPQGAGTAAAEHRALGAYAVLDQLREAGFGSQPPVAYRALDFLVAHGFAHKIERLNAFVACAHPGESHARLPS